MRALKSFCIVWFDFFNSFVASQLRAYTSFGGAGLITVKIITVIKLQTLVDPVIACSSELGRLMVNQSIVLIGIDFERIITI